MAPQLSTSSVEQENPYHGYPNSPSALGFRQLLSSGPMVTQMMQSVIAAFVGVDEHNELG